MSDRALEMPELQMRELIEGARELDVSLEGTQASAMLRLLDELQTWNQRYNLTAIRARAAMLRAHLLDSLSVGPDLAGAHIADVGTGAGFPGLPLAIAQPQRAFTLIDSVGKKLRFVTHAAAELELSNVTPLQARVETLLPATPFDTVIARAFAELPKLLESVRGLCGPRTRVLAMKGRYPQRELAALPRGWRLEGVRPVHIPGLDVERHVVRLVPDAPEARLSTS